MDKPQGVGTLIFSSYVGSGQASTVHPKKYQEFQAPQIDIWNFSNPKIYPPFCTLTFRKTLKCIEMTSKYSPILWWPQKNIHKIFIPPKIFDEVFWKSQKIFEIQIFEPQKTAQAYVYMKISEYTPPPPSPLVDKRTSDEESHFFSNLKFQTSLFVWHLS